jgi:hypothetical protein
LEQLLAALSLLQQQVFLAVPVSCVVLQPRYSCITCLQKLSCALAQSLLPADVDFLFLRRRRCCCCCSAGTQLDAFLSIAHLTAALAAPDISLPLLVVAAAQFALFAGADMTLLMHVWRAHNQHQHQHQQLRTQQTQRLGQAFAQQFDRQSNNNSNMMGSRMSLLSLPLLAESAAAAAMQQWQLQAQRVRTFISGDSDSDSSSSSSSRGRRGRFQSAANAAVDAAAAAVVQLATGRSLLLLYVRFYLVLLLGEWLS